MLIKSELFNLHAWQNYLCVLKARQSRYFYSSIVPHSHNHATPVISHLSGSRRSSGRKWSLATQRLHGWRIALTKPCVTTSSGASVTRRSGESSPATLVSSRRSWVTLLSPRTRTWPEGPSGMSGPGPRCASNWRQSQLKKYKRGTIEDWKFLDRLHLGTRR